MKRIFILFVVLCFSCGAKEEVKAVSTEELQRLVEKDTIQLVDVRTTREYNDGYIQKAILIDVISSNFVNKAKKQLDKKTPVYLYCRTGRRSIKAATILQKEGYDVRYLEGGYTAWNKKTKNK